MVLHEKGIDFEMHEVDLSNKSEEFLSVSPYGKVPVLRVNGTSLYESNIVNEYLDEVYFFPSIFGVRVGAQRGHSEEQIREAKRKLDDAMSRLERQLEGRQYLTGEYSLADIAHTGNFHRLREMAEIGEVPLHEYPNVAAWMERIENRKSYKASA